MKLANKGDRLLNYAIDNIIILNGLFVICLIISMIGLYFDAFLMALIFAIIHTAYYQYFEFVKGGITIGKQVTRTRVINLGGKSPTFSEILVRTVLRFFFLDQLSYLFGTEIGIHDWFSNTMVVKMSKGTHSTCNP